MESVPHGILIFTVFDTFLKEVLSIIAGSSDSDFMDSNPVQSLNASSLILSIPLPIVKLRMCEHASNADFPIEVTEFGIVMPDILSN